MHGNVTLVRPATGGGAAARLFSAFPPDLVDQIRGRVQLLALLFAAAFAFDPLFWVVAKVLELLTAFTPPPEPAASTAFRIIDGGLSLLSLGLWWVARNRKVPPDRVHTIGLVYAAIVCLEVSVGTNFRYFIENGILPNLTWVPVVVILFPLVLPGPPLRMTVSSAISASMAPLGILLLDLTNRVTPSADSYASAIISSVFAVACASFGARVVYRLGREVSQARELGSYRLTTRLGTGGMGEVWSAEHRMLARGAAVKLVRATIAHGPEARARFEREAQTIALLRSPHTVDLFDFGVADDGSFYYAMELLDGLDADSFVRRFGPLPPARSVFILRQMCHSLSEASTHGLVHRDIKPANIFLCRYGEDCDFVKVLDFGLVTALADPETPTPGLTKETAIQGTPAFIAPEQALGRPDLDGRVDVYATGCVAYWLLTGEQVFTGDHAMSLVLQHATDEPRPPSARTSRPIPPELDALILACLAKDRTKRPPTAAALSDALESLDLPDRWTGRDASDWWAEHLPDRPLRTGDAYARSRPPTSNP